MTLIKFDLTPKKYSLQFILLVFGDTYWQFVFTCEGWTRRDFCSMRTLINGYITGMLGGDHTLKTRIIISLLTHQSRIFYNFNMDEIEKKDSIP